MKDYNPLIRKNILELLPYSSARSEYSGAAGTFLDANENPFGFYNRYPNSSQNTLKQRLSEIKNITAEQIFIGNGSDEIIDLTFRIFCEPGTDKALTFSPTYGMYKVAASINNVELIEMPLLDNFQIDRANLAKQLNDDCLKLIIICSPNNPTGNAFNADDIEFILKNFNGIVLLDEAYIDFCLEKSMVPRVQQYPNLIVCQTLSKAWGLAAVRIGIGIMSSELLGYFDKVRAPYNASSVNQQVALYQLQKEDEYQQNLQIIINEKYNLIAELRQLSIVKKVYPSDTNFLLIEVTNADNLYQKLIQQQIIIRNRNSIIKNCVRITIGSPEENQQLLHALKLIS